MNRMEKYCSYVLWPAEMLISLLRRIHDFRWLSGVNSISVSAGMVLMTLLGLAELTGFCLVAFDRSRPGMVLFGIFWLLAAMLFTFAGARLFRLAERIWTGCAVPVSRSASDVLLLAVAVFAVGSIGVEITSLFDTRSFPPFCRAVMFLTGGAVLAGTLLQYGTADEPEDCVSRCFAFIRLTMLAVCRTAPVAWCAGTLVILVDIVSEFGGTFSLRMKMLSNTGSLLLFGFLPAALYFGMLAVRTSVRILEKLAARE